MALKSIRNLEQNITFATLEEDNKKIESWTAVFNAAVKEFFEPLYFREKEVNDKMPGGIKVLDIKYEKPIYTDDNPLLISNFKDDEDFIKFHFI